MRARKMNGLWKKGTHILALSVFLTLCLLGGCANPTAVSVTPVETHDAGEPDESVRETETTEQESKAETQPEEDAGPSAEELERLARGDVHLEAARLADWGNGAKLYYEETSGELLYTLEMSQIPESDDAYLYLFAQDCLEDRSVLEGEPEAQGLKGRVCTLSFPYEQAHLFSRFVPALLIDGKYLSVGEGVFLSNPGALAENREAYPVMDSKKGLLLDPAMLGTQELTDLDVKYSIYNIPLSQLFGETTQESYPTIHFPYKGEVYDLNGYTVAAYDGLFTYLTQLGMCNTAIVLNDWNDNCPELIHPEAADRDSGAFYYMFNTAQEEGIRALEAAAVFLTQRYSSGEHGMVHNWVIANEINQKKWNYMDTQDLAHYAKEFEKGFRIFYLAAKSAYANARVSFSIDHDWNSNGGDNSEYFNARELIAAFQEAAAAHGNYDWGLAIHPYPDPLSRINFWSQKYEKTQDAETLSIMNLNVLTDFLGQEAYLDTAGKMRHIAITELGFSSKSGEKLQAAAFAYCYYIVKNNPYIDAFMMNRQTDAPEEIRQGLAFGIYTYDGRAKYLRDVYRDIDTEKGEAYLDSMLHILKADSLEEALSWAQK